MKPVLFFVLLFPLTISCQNNHLDTTFYNNGVVFVLGDTLKQSAPVIPTVVDHLDFRSVQILDTLEKPYAIIFKKQNQIPSSTYQDTIMIAVKSGQKWEVWLLFLGTWLEYNLGMHTGYETTRYTFERGQIDGIGNEELIIKCSYYRSINLCPNYEAYSESYENMSIWNLDRKELYLSLLTIYTYDWWCAAAIDEGQKMTVYKIYYSNKTISIQKCVLQFQSGGTNSGAGPEKTTQEKYTYVLKDNYFIRVK
ncbi:MAG: hypothetical protein L6Q81_08105 [Bacteroidia bacterium]|nr:hypothetical protein [Bacteroidia bacterium]